MAALDFKEIPVPTAGASRDQFELLAREFLEHLGFKVIVGPDRGPDAGRDLIVEELRSGIAGASRLRWLVSCKHKAHSGASVTPEDEPDIHDRVRTHGCQGFLAVYSTVPSSGLAAKLNAAALPFEVQIYDSERIEGHLLRSQSGLQLAQRFFPESSARWKSEHPTPAKIFAEQPALHCMCCGKPLLAPKPDGIVVIWTTSFDRPEGTKRRTEYLYWCCYGACDKALNRRYSREGISDGWESLSDLAIPLVYIRWIMVVMNELQSGETYSPEASENMKTLLLNLFPLIARHLTEAEQERIQSLMMIPSYLGGLGPAG